MSKLSICICTYNRPAILKRCLDSIFNGSDLPDEIIVSDDSEAFDHSFEICRQFNLVRYVHNPSRGLSSNRNFAIKNATSEFVSLLDDDAILGFDFVLQCRQLISKTQPKSIYTGPILEAGSIIVAGRTSLLGYFRPTKNGVVENLNLNSNLFPLTAFDQVKFDEKIMYGFEDMDLCAGLRCIGYTIIFIPTLINEHDPPKKHDTAQSSQSKKVEYSRFYTSIKRYKIWQPSFIRLWIFLILAPIHLSISWIKSGKFADSYLPYLYIFLAYRTVIRHKNSIAANVKLGPQK